MLPTYAKVESGVVCTYAATGSHALVRHKILTSAQASALASAVSKLRLGVLLSPTTCGDATGKVVIIGLTLDGAVVSLWYQASGCQSLDNGSVQSGQNSNPSFARFQKVLASLR